MGTRLTLSTNRVRTEKKERNKERGKEEKEDKEVKAMAYLGLQV